MRKICCLKKMLVSQKQLIFFFFFFLSPAVFPRKKKKNLTRCLQYGPPPFIRPLTLNTAVFLWTKLSELVGFCCSRL